MSTNVKINGNFSTELVSYNAASSLVHFEKTKIFSITTKNALAYVIRRRRCSCKFRVRRIGPEKRINK
jgi:hypothetical protein